MKKNYTDSSLDKCLDLASEDLKIPKEKLQYTVLEEKKSFFKKTITIAIEIPEEEVINDADGLVAVKDGKVIVTNPRPGGRPAVIIPSMDIILTVNGNQIRGRAEVFEDSNIEIQFGENNASRKMDIRLTDDHMEAYLNIRYVPKEEYALKPKESSREINLESLVVREQWPPTYTVEEIRQELSKCKITTGIIESNLNACEKNKEIKDLLIAKGTPPIESKDDSLEFKFNIDSDIRKLKEDSSGNIDFKNVGAVDEVSKGTVLAIKHIGIEGKDGVNVTGKTIRHNPKKSLVLKVGGGCSIKDNDTILAEINGKPCVKNNVIFVFQVHEVQNDVDLKTGNVKFHGDVVIKGGVKEGMKVDSGNSIQIFHGVERAEILGKGDIEIKGNVIASQIMGGGQDVERLKQLEDLSQLENSLKALVAAIEEIKKFNLLGYDRSDGEIIKILLETKFKMFPRICLKLMADIAVSGEKNDEYNVKLIGIIKNKLIGLAALSVKHYSDILEIFDIISHRNDALKRSLALPVNVKISYAQDSQVSSTGDVIITGKGVYVSEITANSNVYFTTDRSVVRGGSIKARSEIKCKTVGSTGGVVTKLIVEGEGHIYADVAFENTLIIVGCREYVLDLACRNLHAYLDSHGELVIDSLRL